jgi:hypothetical protein
LHEYLSYLEICLHYLLECNPLVVDFREQYPFYFNDDMEALIIEHKGKAPRNKVPTYDFVVTYLDRPGTDTFYYQATSVKYVVDTKTEKFRRRRDREISDATAFGWKWRLFTEQDVNRVKLENCIHLVEANRYTDIYAQAADSLDYAIELLNLRRVKSFDAELERMAVRAACSGEQSLSLFATAVVHGFILFDFERPWDLTRPLHLKM